MQPAPEATGQIHLAETVQAASPMDTTVAAFDPDLPTLGLDMSFSQADPGDQWAFLSRVPSMSPVEAQLDLEDQFHALGQRDERTHPGETMAFAPTTGDAALASWPGWICGNESVDNSVLCDDARRPVARQIFI